MDSARRCVACNGRVSLAPSASSGVQLARCQDCGSASTNPVPSSAALDEGYSQTYYGPENVKFVTALERVVTWETERRARSIHDCLQPRSRILEIGCGRGLLLKSLSQLGHECQGIERSELAAARCRKIAGIQIYTQEVRACGFQDGSFDLVVLWHVLEHLDAPGETLDETARILKPGGLLILEVPNLSSFQARLSGRHWFHLDLDRHLYHFTRQGLHQLLAKTGFQTLQTSTFSWEQSPFGVLQSLLNALGFPREQLYRMLKRETSPRTLGKLLQLLTASLLALPSTAFAVTEAAANSGGVLSVKARKIGV
ncbi:MAG: class I SAM-dependent methyltransferase [Acidobacteria bacterium]|nr:class I SAM-dependent methyltransferase [Acidobacteriota bacterium]MCI0621965.1 class I SAM-dependent methyltransferase [Acidobacteriota bacterium]MCI0721159.1 class I SAM-dependent methyltransferase [Acidobacteriota bacterium]